jgi:hypothetical protein
MRRLLRRPSPAMVIAVIALFLAIGGTTYAITLPAGSVGPAQLRPQAVLNSKLYPGAVSNTKMGRGAVTFSKMANNQMTSIKMRNGSLLGEDLAANTVTGAQIDESSLGITRFALVAANGGLVNSSGGISVAGQAGNTTYVNFGSAVSGRPILATINGGTAGQISAAPCGGPSSTNPGGVNCPAAFNNTSTVAVDTGAGNLPFYVAVMQA